MSPRTARLGTPDSRLGNIEPGLGAPKYVAPLTKLAEQPQLVVEVAFPNSPIDTAGFFNTILQDNPTSCWRMDTAATLTDEAGSGNTLVVDGAPTLIAGALTGDSDQALAFSGSGEDAVAPSNEALSPTGPMTLEFWMRYAAAPAATKMLVGKGRSYWAELRTDGKVQFTVRQGSTFTTVVSAAALATGAWYLIDCVYDGADLLLYVNGALSAAVPYASGIAATTLPFTIARADDSTSPPGYRGEWAAGIDGQATSLTLFTPAATVDGDYMLAAIHTVIQNGPVTAPAGWTLVAEAGVGWNQVLQVWGKYAAGADAASGASYTWTWQNSVTFGEGSISAYYNVDQAVPTGATAANADHVKSISVLLAPIFDNTLIAGFFAGELDGAQTLTPGTKQFDNNQTYAFETFPLGARTTETLTGVTNDPADKCVVAVELVGPIAPVSYTQVDIDDVSFWNAAALTSTQIADHFSAAATAPTTVTWTDVTADLRSLSFAYGRQYELDRMEALTGTSLLADGKRDYDPANTLSPHYPNVIPLRQIRGRVVLDGASYPLFKGFIERWESQWSLDQVNEYAEVQVTFVDGFEPLGLAAMLGAIPAGTSGASIASLLTHANWPTPARRLDNGVFNIGAITMDGSTPILSYIQKVADGEGGIFFIDAAGNAVFHDKNHRTATFTSNTSQATFSDSEDGGLPYSDLVPSKDKDQIVNDWHVTDGAGGDHEASDTASINTYFRRTQTLDTFLSAADAATVAADRLAATKDPGYRIDSIELTLTDILETWQQALGRGISDRITVHRQPVKSKPGSQITGDFWIERIEWTWQIGELPKVRWQLSPAT